MTSKTLRIITLGLLALLAFACDKDDEAGVEDLLPGIWMLSEKVIDGQAVTLSDCEKQSTIEFFSHNICVLYDACEDTSVNSGWSYTYEMLNISVHLPAAYYVEHIDNSSLRISRYDITDEGGLQSTLFSYNRQS